MWKEMKPPTEATAAFHASWYQRKERAARSPRHAARADQPSCSALAIAGAGSC